MAIDKSLYAAPEGLPDEALMAPPIEIEIEDPESVSIEMGGMEIELEKREPTAEDFDANLADFMGDEQLEGLAGRQAIGSDQLPGVTLAALGRPLACLLHRIRIPLELVEKPVQYCYLPLTTTQLFASGFAY